MREMQEQMKKMEQNMAEQETRQKQKTRAKVDGDYIDYEELK
jgi:DNA-binding protein YbaB